MGRAALAAYSFPVVVERSLRFGFPGGILRGVSAGLYPALPGELNLFERRLVESRTTVIIPFNDRVVFVSLLNCAKFSSRRSEVPQTLDAIS
jgi:hypothetical protein